jgi:flagellar biosynthesis protein FlhF
MKNTKRYRAETLREALEQIKQDLGEEALVVSHKRVRSGGVLGIGAREMIEVYAALDPGKPAGERKTANAPSRQKSEPAAKPPATPDQAQPTPALAALASRLYKDMSTATAAVAVTSNLPAARKAFPDPTPHEPRKPSALATLAAGPTTAALSTEPVAARGNAVATELNRLRSEMREMKLSLAVFGRPTLTNGRVQEATKFEGDPRVYDTPYYEAYIGLLDSGLMPEMARQVMERVVQYAGHNKSVEEALADLLPATIGFAEDQLTVNPGTPGAPVASVFIGPTGVGKTTTIAKLAAHVALGARRRVELITLDTYRIAAVEQLRKYAELIGAGCHVARSVAELDQLVRRFAGQAKIFIDTAGRSPNDLADQLELIDYLRGAPDILKCLVLQATTHPADALVAVKKFGLFGCNQLIITKLDETTRPGASVGIIAEASLPLAYICAGQRIPDDIQRASSTTLAARVLRATLLGVAAAA